MTANVLDALPKRLHIQAKTALAKIYTADSRTAAVTAAKAFADDFAEFPKATAKITGQLDVLLAFYGFPAEHWVHLRTTNPIESTFSTVRLRTRVTRGAGSRTAALAMTYKLVSAAQQRWRRITGAEVVGLVRRRRHLHRRQAAGEEHKQDGHQDNDQISGRQGQEDRVRRRLIRRSHPQLLTITRETLIAGAPCLRPTGHRRPLLCRRDRAPVQGFFLDLLCGGGGGIR